MKGMLFILMLVSSSMVMAQEVRSNSFGGIFRLLETPGSNIIDSSSLVCEEQEAGNVSRINMCEDFYSYACSDPTLSTRKEAYESREQESLGALMRRDNSQDPRLGHLNEMHELGVISILEERPEQWKRYIRHNEQRQLENSGITSRELSNVLNEVKRDTIQYLRSLSLTPRVRNDAIRLVSDYRLLNFDQYEQFFRRNVRDLLIKKGETRSDVNALTNKEIKEFTMQMYGSTCGAWGSNPNAFTLMGASVALVCPGLLGFLNEVKGQSKDQILLSIKTILAHEIGHNIPLEVVNPMKSCLETDLGIDSLDGLTERQKSRLIENQITEFNSDLWMLEMTLKGLKSKNVRGEEAARQVASSMTIFCDSTPVAEEDPYNSHPSGQLRVTLLSRNPEFRSLLGCEAPTNETPACTLSGRVPNLGTNP